MYYFLEKIIVDDINHYSLKGMLYDKNKKKVDKVFDGVPSSNKLVAPFTFILDDSSSLISNKRILTDKVSCSGRGSGFLFLASPKAQNLFQSIGTKDIEMYEIQIKGSKLELNDYKIVRILDKIDCVNLTESILKYDEDFGSIKRAKSIVLNHEKIPKEKQIFLMGKRSTSVIIVHEDFKKSIENSGLTGFNFYKLDEAIMVIG